LKADQSRFCVHIVKSNQPISITPAFDHNLSREQDDLLQEENNNSFEVL